ncbi:MAG: glycosyl transferase [Epsilonproteobacteria bacterium]|nr:MAG: glycosyl transferase [Campylobacterota bacterium]
MDKNKNQFTQYLKAVGTGPKHNYDMTKEQITDCFEMILSGEVSPEQIGAFLIAWRLKPETNDEFKAVVELFNTKTTKQTVQNSCEIGYPYDGKRNNPYMFVSIAKMLLSFGINIVVTGDELQPSKNGVTVKDIATNIVLPSNLYYFDRTKIFKSLSSLTSLRNNLGIRTGLNTIERLSNPANSSVGITGVFHKPFMEKYKAMFENQYDKLVIIKGNEGTSEIYSKTLFWVIQNGKAVEQKIDPSRYGITYQKSWDNITLDESLEMINNPTKEFLHIVRLNSALVLFIMNKANSINEAYEKLI